MAVHILTVNGVERPLRLGSLDFQSVINGRDVMNCRIVSEAGAYRPPLAQVVKLNEDGTDIFGGIIDQADETGADNQPLPDIETEIACPSFGVYADWLHITETFPVGTSIASIAGTIVTNYLGPNYSVTLDGAQVTGPSLTAELIADEELLSAFLERLATITGYNWTISPTKAFKLYAAGVDAAPFDVIDGDGNHVGDIRVTRSRQKYYNRIIVKFGDNVKIPYRQQFVGDGIADTFALDFAIQGFLQNVPEGAAAYGAVDVAFGPDPTESIGGLLSPAGVIWEYDPSGPSITRRSGAVANGDQFSLLYDVQFPQVVRAEDAGEIAANGLKELRVSLPDVYSKAEAQEYADALLAQSLATTTTVEYLTRQTGIVPGMSQTITAADRNVNGAFLITEVRASTRTDSQDVWRVVKAINLSTFNGSYRDVYRAWLGNGSRSAGTGPETSTGGCGWDYWDKAIGLALIDHADGAVVARGSSGGPDVGVEGIPAVLRLTSKRADDGIAQLAIGHNDDEPEDDLIFWQIHGSSPGARDTQMYIEHEGDGVVLAEYKGTLDLWGEGIDIAPGDPDVAGNRTNLGGLTLHSGIALYVNLITSFPHTVDTNLNVFGSAYLLRPSAAGTLNLPSLSVANVSQVFSGSNRGARVLVLKNDSAFVVTVDPNSTDTINGRATYPLMPGETLKIMGWNGTTPNWTVLHSHRPPIEVALTDAQLKALPTTRVAAIPSPGSGWRIKIRAATLFIDNTTADYTNINATYSSIHLESTFGHVLVTPIWTDSAYGLAQTTDFLAGPNGHKYCDFLIPFVNAIDDSPDAAGTWLYIKNQAGVNGTAEVDDDGVLLAMDNNGSGNLTGGNGNNSGRLVIDYTIEKTTI